MEDFFGTITAKDLGLTFLVAVAILMIFRGLLVPIRYYDQMKSTLEAQVALEREAKDNFKAAYEDEKRQKDLLLQQDDIAHHALSEIREHVKERRPEGGGKA